MEHRNAAPPSLIEDSIRFFKGFVSRPKEIASIVPSSSSLIRRVLGAIEVDRAAVIVELGPGTGVLTRAILDHMPATARLVALEINPGFVDLLRGREGADPRAAVVEGAACDIEAALRSAGETRADVVVSGIPFSTMDPDEAHRTVEAISRVLAPEGRFVAYQMRGHVRRFAEPIFGPAEVLTELWNIPPMRIYRWQLPVC